MKHILIILFSLQFSLFFSQDTTSTGLPSINTTEINFLKQAVNAIEITLYEGSQTLSIQGTNCKFFGNSIDTKAPDSLNAKNDAYLMIITNDEFYMDVEISYTPTNAYLIIKKDKKVYYNKLNPSGIRTFGQLMGNK